MDPSGCFFFGSRTVPRVGSGGFQNLAGASRVGSGGTRNLTSRVMWISYPRNKHAY